MEVFPASSREEWLQERERQDALKRQAILRMAREFQQAGYSFRLDTEKEGGHILLAEGPRGSFSLKRVPVLYAAQDDFHRGFYIEEALHHFIESPHGHMWGAVKPEEFMWVIWGESLRNSEN